METETDKLVRTVEAGFEPSRNQNTGSRDLQFDTSYTMSEWDSSQAEQQQGRSISRSSHRSITSLSALDAAVQPR
jgi:hypothetical protein